MKYHCKVSDATFVPRQGDRLTNTITGEEYEILGVDTIVLGTRYRMWCRDVT